MSAPELTAAKRLLDLAKRQGFVFQRVAPGPDGPLFARRETIEYRDELYLGGFGDSCYATKARKSSLIVCDVHQGSGHLVVRREGDRIVLDGHTDDCCLISLGDPAAALLFGKDHRHHAIMSGLHWYPRQAQLVYLVAGHDPGTQPLTLVSPASTT